MSATENPDIIISSEPEVLLSDSFKEATSNLVKRYLKYFKCKYLGSKYYSEIYKKEPEFLMGTFKQLVDQLRDLIKEDIEKLCNDQQLYEKLLELDNLHKESKLSKDVKAWRPSGDPEEDLRDHRIGSKLVHRDLLKNLLQKIQSENDQLHEEIMSNHKHIMSLKERVIQQDEQNQAVFHALDEVDFHMIENVEQISDS